MPLVCFYSCACVCACLVHPSLVQSFVGSRWIGRSQVALMSSTASCSMFIASPMWSCWWGTPTCTATCCPSTMTTTTTKPSPPPALYSGYSCRGKVSTMEVFAESTSLHLFVTTDRFWNGNTNKDLVLALNSTAQKYANAVEQECM